MDKIKLLEATAKRIMEASCDIRAFVNELVDEASFVETDTFLSGKSIFDDNEAAGEGVLTGYASIDGMPVYVIAQNAAVLSGSFGVAQAKKIIKCMDNAIANEHVILSVLASSGARVGEGVNCLEAFAMVLNKAVEAQAYVPHIAIAKGNVVGHMASFLSTADFVFAGKDAIISHNPPTVLATKANKQSKDLFGVNMHSKESGLIDFVYSDNKDLKTKITLLFDYTNVFSSDSADDPNRESKDLVKNNSSGALLAALADGGRCLEYSADYAKEAKCYFARVNGIAVGIVASDAQENDYLTVKSADKITSFISLLDDYELPLVTLVNSKGVNTTIGEEQDCAICYVSGLINTVATASIPKIGVIVGNATGMAYTCLASKGIGYDYTIAFPDSLIAPINSDTAVNLVYSEELKAKGNSPELRAKLEALYNDENASPFIAAKEGFIDEIIHPSALRPYIANALMMLLGL